MQLGFIIGSRALYLETAQGPTCTHTANVASTWYAVHPPVAILLQKPQLWQRCMLRLRMIANWRECRAMCDARSDTVGWGAL